MAAEETWKDLQPVPPQPARGLVELCPELAI